jgi:hypothetical protein
MSDPKQELEQWMIEHPIPTVNSRHIQKIIDYYPSMLNDLVEDIDIYSRFDLASQWTGLDKDEFIKKLTMRDVVSIVRDLKQRRGQWNVEYEAERKRLVEKYKSRWNNPIRNWSEFFTMSGKKQKNKKRSTLKKHRNKKRTPKKM